MAGYDDKLRFIDQAAADLEKATTAAERQMLAEIVTIIAALEQKGGTVLTSTKNLTFASALKEALEQILLDSKYIQAVRDYAKAMDTLAEMNIKYYAGAEDYAASAEFAALTAVNKRQAVDLLLGGAIDREFYTPIISAITQGVSTNVGYTEMNRTIRDLVIGSDAQNGRLSRYVGQIAYDTMAVADRTYSRQVADEVGIDFFAFVGGVIDDTREWCAQRNGGTWHRKEVEKWASQDWQGKNKQTNSSTIFVLLGGYNCKHSLIPVPLSAVPVSDIQRNLSNGNLKLNARQREILGV